MRYRITPEARRKLWAYIEAVNVEVGGLGYAFLTHDDKNNVLIEWRDTFLIPQQVSATEVEFDDGSMVAGIERAAADGVLDDPDFIWVSWHSHHTMKPFWSGTDEKCIQTYGTMGIKHLLSFVGCHNHDYRMRFDHFGVAHHGIEVGQVTMDDQRLTVLEDDFDAAIAADIKANVRHQTIRPKPLPKFRQPTPVKRELPGAKLESAFANKEEEQEFYELRKELIDEGYSPADADAEATRWFSDDPGGYVIYPREADDGFSNLAWEHFA